MENDGKISLISKKFWISYINYYYNGLKKIFSKTRQHLSKYILLYGFEALLLIGKNKYIHRML